MCYKQKYLRTKHRLYGGFNEETWGPTQGVVHNYYKIDDVNRWSLKQPNTGYSVMIEQNSWGNTLNMHSQPLVTEAASYLENKKVIDRHMRDVNYNGGFNKCCNIIVM